MFMLLARLQREHPPAPKTATRATPRAANLLSSTPVTLSSAPCFTQQASGRGATCGVTGGGASFGGPGPQARRE
eukprot:13604058-Alexandrium_andersonii.AAC.1